MAVLLFGSSILVLNQLCHSVTRWGDFSLGNVFARFLVLSKLYSKRAREKESRRIRKAVNDDDKWNLVNVNSYELLLKDCQVSLQCVLSAICQSRAVRQ